VCVCGSDGRERDQMNDGRLCVRVCVYICESVCMTVSAGVCVCMCLRIIYEKKII
jgi:hypothetical protein